MNIDRRQFFSKGLAAGGVGLGAGLMGVQALMNPAQAKPIRHGAGLLAEDLGVRANARSDQTHALQNAIYQASKQKKPLYLPAGRIRTRGLSLPNHCHLIGVAHNTELSFQGGRALLSCKGASSLHLEGLTLTGNSLRVNTALVSLHNVKKLSLTQCVINHSLKNGVSLHNCGGLVGHNEFHDIKETALFCENSKGLEISHNLVHHIKNNGIQVWRSRKGYDGTIISHNRIKHIASQNGGSGQHGNGINVFRAHDVMVSNNHISHCKFSAVRFNSASNAQIMNNHCLHMGEVALYVEFAFEGAVVSNNIVDDAATGVSVTNFKEGGRLATVTGNLIRNIKKHPIETGHSSGIFVEADCVVSNNVIETSIHNGISVGWGKYVRDVVVSANLIRQCQVGIALTGDERGGAMAIHNNVISHTKKGAIRAIDHDRYIGTDLTKKGAKQYPNFSIINNVSS